MREISICIPSYNRYQLTIDSIAKVLDDHRVTEIVIVDDCSTDDSYNRLISWATHIQETLVYTKIEIYQNTANQDCYWNKRIAIEHATNDWCILLDSDNVIDKSYLDQLFAIENWDTYTIYTPSFAKPHFDFRNFSGLTIDRHNVKKYLYLPMFETMLNAANFFVNKEEYLMCFDSSKDPVTSDSIFTCYNWLRSGNSIQVVPGLEYEHRVHEGSHYQNNIHRTPAGFHQEILNKLAAL